MKTYQKSMKSGEDHTLQIAFEPDVIFLFISPGYGDATVFVSELSARYPDASITGCSTSGEIMNTQVDDNSIVLSALKFETTKHRISSVIAETYDNSHKAGASLADQLMKDDLKHILVFSDGLRVNGAELVKGFSDVVPSSVSVTGGLAGDGTDFSSTYTIKNGEILTNSIVGLGLYGSDLKVAYSSKAGWDSFGIERKVTRSVSNVLYELDGKPALELYKSYLGKQAEDLPGSGLLFPLSMRVNETDAPLVRTILAVNEEEQSLTFAGSIHQDSYVRLMKGNMDRLINGAEGSAENVKASIGEDEAEFALLISCVGRRLVLKQQVEEEVEVVREVLGDCPLMTGFYSYGELAPFGKSDLCQLHNQTMTITTFSESLRK